MKTAAYQIRCLTNMHVGASGSTYDVIENPVQRSTNGNIPCIYSSSLKGALRQYFKQYFKQCHEETPKTITHIFGAEIETKETANSAASQGAFSFFQADLWAIPVPQTDTNAEQPYKLVSNACQQKQIQELAKLLGIETLGIEGAIAQDDEWNQACKYLPVIARNCLDNGKSTNLWYEEVLPAGSILIFFVAYDDEEKFREFDTTIEDNGPVQIGANASIGYGFCKITKLTNQ